MVFRFCFMQSNSNKEKWNLTNVLQSELFWKLLHKSHTSQKVLTLLNQQWELNTKTWSLWQTDRRVVIWAWDKAGQKKKKKRTRHSSAASTKLRTYRDRECLPCPKDPSPTTQFQSSRSRPDNFGSCKERWTVFFPSKQENRL